MAVVHDQDPRLIDPPEYEDGVFVIRSGSNSALTETIDATEHGSARRERAGRWPPMSVEKVARESGVAWRARWRQDGRNRAKTFSTYKDARTFDGDVHRRRRLDDLAALDAGKETLAEFADEWWDLHASRLRRRRRRPTRPSSTFTSSLDSAACVCGTFDPK